MYPLIRLINRNISRLLNIAVFGSETFKTNSKYIVSAKYILFFFCLKVLFLLYKINEKVYKLLPL